MTLNALARSWASALTVPYGNSLVLPQDCATPNQAVKDSFLLAQGAQLALIMQGVAQFDIGRDFQDMLNTTNNMALCCLRLSASARPSPSTRRIFTEIDELRSKVPTTVITRHSAFSPLPTMDRAMSVSWANIIGSRDFMAGVIGEVAELFASEQNFAGFKRAIATLAQQLSTIGQNEIAAKLAAQNIQIPPRGQVATQSFRKIHQVLWEIDFDTFANTVSGLWVSGGLWSYNFLQEEAEQTAWQSIEAASPQDRSEHPQTGGPTSRSRYYRFGSAPSRRTTYAQSQRLKAALARKMPGPQAPNTIPFRNRFRFGLGD